MRLAGSNRTIVNFFISNNNHNLLKIILTIYLNYMNLIVLGDYHNTNMLLTPLYIDRIQRLSNT